MQETSLHTLLDSESKWSGERARNKKNDYDPIERDKVRDNLLYERYLL